MSTLRAVVFTRPYPIGLGDYTFFVRPVEFVKDRRYFDAHIRNVLHEDDSGTIGSIKGRRWHVLRRGDLVIVGMATNEFGRRDESGRAIRGYYGFVMPANDIKLPSETLFKELDKVCVEPAFMQAPVRTKDSDRLSGELFDDPAQYKVVLDSHKWNFNTNPSRISFHCCDEVGDILSSALAAASQNTEFEIVIGLNTEDHAKRLPILNCVCHAVSVAKDIQFPEHTTITERKPERKPDSVEVPRNVGKAPSDDHNGPIGIDIQIKDLLESILKRKPSTRQKIWQTIQKYRRAAAIIGCVVLALLVAAKRVFSRRGGADEAMAPTTEERSRKSVGETLQGGSFTNIPFQARPTTTVTTSHQRCSGKTLFPWK